MKAGALSTPACRICGAEDGHTRYRPREMMYGLRERFPYFQCGSCGCLQIERVPDDLERFYPADYYAHTGAHRPRGLRGRLRRLRNRYALLGRGSAGRVLARLHPYPVPGARNWFRRWRVTPETRILDVGCGSGDLLFDLHDLGLRRLLGIDPFLAEERTDGPGPTLLRRTIHEVEGVFDAIMLHHALEHVADPVDTLAAAARLLDPEGECLVRTPTVSSLAWERYREDWAQLDAPRHLVIHSLPSMEIAAERAGLRVAHVEWDSTELQFTASELYRRDIPLREGGEQIPRDEVRRFARLAEELNRTGRGDSAAFYLKKAGSETSGSDGAGGRRV